MVRMNQRATAIIQAGKNGEGKNYPHKTPNARASQVCHQVAHANIQGFGEAHECSDAGGFLPALQFPKINWMQLRLFSQRLLTQLRPLAKAANGLSNNLLIRQRFGHALSGKQEPSKANTVYSPLFMLALPDRQA